MGASIHHNTELSSRKIKRWIRVHQEYNHLAGRLQKWFSSVSQVVVIGDVGSLQDLKQIYGFISMHQGCIGNKNTKRRRDLTVCNY